MADSPTTATSSARNAPRAAASPIGDLVSGPAVIVEAKASLRSVAQTLGDLGIGMVVVLEGGTVAGVVSERDLVWAIARDAELDDVWAADIMTQEVVSVAPSTTLVEAAETMTSNNARHILVDYPTGPSVVSIREVVARLVGD